MRICRAQVGQDVFYALMEGDLLRKLEKDPFSGLQPGTQTYPLGSARLLGPVLPGKVVCMGKNYADHAAEMGGDAPETPLIFIKPSTSVIGPEDGIDFPPDCKRLDYEAELAVVIGKRCKDVPRERYQDVIFGYTCLNDITARDLQALDGQWTRGKSYDTFCPIGPWIETELDAHNVQVQSRLNGKVCQNASTSILIHRIDEIIYFITRVMTLLPGDVIATGTPAGIGPMQKGDTIEIEVGGIGVLRNHVNV